MGQRGPALFKSASVREERLEAQPGGEQIDLLLI